MKAINAARMALWGDDNHHVSLDQVIATMRETGADMNHKYKEKALGGPAVNACQVLKPRQTPPTPNLRSPTFMK